MTPLVAGPDLPRHWARIERDLLTRFVARPGGRDVRDPMIPGQARLLAATTRSITIHFGGASHPVTLDFAPGRSACLELTAGKVERIVLDGPGASKPI